MTNTKSKVPKLRFPEFSEEWSRKTFIKSEIDAVDGDRGKNYPTKSEFMQSGHCIFLSTKNVTTNGFNFRKLSYISSKRDEILNNGKLIRNDLVITTRGTVGNIAHFSDEVSFENIRINSGMAILRVKSDKVDPKYLYAFMYSPSFSDQVRRVIFGSAQQQLTIKEIKKFVLSVTSLSEQKKIALLLSTTDKKISLLKQKREQLVQYKKGIMQQLLSQKLRFKDDNGQEFPDWEEVHLNEITSPIKRKAAIGIENVMTISASKGFLHQKERFSQVIAGTSLEKYTLIKEGEFSYNRGNSKSYTYGCIYKLSGDKEALVPFIYRSFKLNKGVADFYAHLFEGKYLDRQLRRLISSSARMDGLLNIGEKDFYKVTIPYPCDDEQGKIADFITSLNQKIGLAKQQIEQTQAYKQGLLQQMFV